MFKVISKYGKELCKMSTYDRAELWLHHYEDMYNMSDLKIVEEKEQDNDSNV